MAGKQLTTNVVIADPDTGAPTYIEAGTVPDEKYADQLGDHLFAEPEADPGPPPQSGKGSGVGAWQEYAVANNVVISEDADREEIIAAVVAAGVPVE